MFPPSAERVPQQTEQRINEKIRRETEKSLAYYQHHPGEIDQRLEELDEEWDVERVLQTNASALMVLSLVLGTVRSRAWYLLSLTVGSFLLQHALQGWCPPLPVIRRLGIRTRREIDIERLGLKAIRGDLQKADSSSSPRELMDVGQ